MLGFGAVDLTLESGELGGEKIVVGRWLAAHNGGLAGSEELGAQQRLADLVEHEGVEFVGPDLPFSAAPFRSACSQPVVIGAAVVVVVSAAAGGGSETVAFDAAGAAHHEPS